MLCAVALSSSIRRTRILTLSSRLWWESLLPDIHEETADILNLRTETSANG